MFYHHLSATSRALTQISWVSYHHLKSYRFWEQSFCLSKRSLFKIFRQKKIIMKAQKWEMEKDLLNIFLLSVPAMVSPTVFYFILFSFKSLKAFYSIFIGKLFQCQSAPQEISSNAQFMFILHKMTDIKCILVGN